jgi:Co/Zn/Cd efflux system component
MPRWFHPRTFLKVFLIFGIARISRVPFESPAMFLVVLGAWAAYEIIERYAWPRRVHEEEG